MNLRPLDEEVRDECSKTKFCRDCKFRVGCMQRFHFYEIGDIDDKNFEIALQMTEINLTEIVDKDTAFEITDNLRKKRFAEMKEHPNFSYN